MSQLLTKTHFLAGRQCPLRLWFELYQPAPKDVSPSQQNLFRWGQRIGARARQLFPTGQRVWAVGEKGIEVTRDLIKGDAPIFFEAGFEADRAFAAIDVLVREPGGFRAIEVKMKSGAKPPDDELLDELAFEYLVMRESGLEVTRMELMRLNPACVFPDLDDLFATVDATAECEARLDAVRGVARQLLPVLDGDRPDIAPGSQCKKPDRCPFFDRCNAPLPPDDIRRLYKLNWRRRDALLAQGITSVHNLPASFTPTPIQARQIKALRTGKRVVEPTLGPTLDRVAFPIAFLDFETINLPVPRFDGMSPWHQVTVQFSCHVLDRDGSIVHHEWLAAGDRDPRPDFAREVLAAVAGAATVVAHHAGFEAERLKEVAAGVPELADQLVALASNLADTEIWLNENVYDPAFDSSFSLKKVLPALTGLGYDDLEVQEGLNASALLEQLLWEPDWLTRSANQLEQDLLTYCERDTEGLMLLWHELRKMAESTGT